MVNRKRKSRSKPIKLSKSVWVRNAGDIKKHREVTLKNQGGVCAVSGVKVDTGVLDHTHEGGIGEDGACRGVLLSEVNMLEGRYLKLFKRLKLDSKYGLNFPDFLIALGTYLKQDNSLNPLHHKHMEDFRRKTSRLRKDVLLKSLKKDFNITKEPTTKVKDLVHLYVQSWVSKLESQRK